jgi:mannose-6-phosphate isomerase-like protein (cupin superfamily)
MARPGDTIENPITGERIIFLQTIEDTGGELLRFEFAASPYADGPPEHPRQEEHWTVTSGVMVVRAGGHERTRGEGRSVAITAGTPHVFRDPGGEEVRF